MKHKQASFRQPKIQSKYSLNFDRKIITEDLKLKMPRVTKKYALAIAILSDHYFTSPYFFHINAAQKGHKIIYKNMADIGYQWNPKLQCWQEK